MLQEYTVTWVVQVHAESFEDAAKQALEIQRDPNSLATVFEVQCGIVCKQVDLAEPEFKFKPSDRAVYRYSGTMDDGYVPHSGQTVRVLGPLSPNSYDFHEVGPMYVIRADDGWTGHVFEDELTLKED